MVRGHALSLPATFAVPGDLATPTGGYAYARRVFRGAAAAGLELEHLPLGEGYPNPSAECLAEAARLLANVPAHRPLLIDGLAFGALPADVTAAIRSPVVALCHHPLALETGIDAGRATELEATEREALALAAAIVTTSGATAAILTARYGVPADRITVAPPGTDPAPRSHGSGGAGCAIVSVGSITPRKGHVKLVRSLAAVSDCEWTLRIIGPSPDPAARKALADEITGNGLEDRVTLTGPLPAMAVAAAYQTADLFVLASEYEGFGMAFAEAMSHGLPVLGLKCDAVAEATQGAARLVTPDAFGDALADLVRRPASRVALAEQCWRAASGLPRWPDTIAGIAGVLRAVA